MRNPGGPLDNQAWYSNRWPPKKLPSFGSLNHATALWPVEQSSILSAKFDWPVACQKLSLLATAHDCETDLFSATIYDVLRSCPVFNAVDAARGSCAAQYAFHEQS